MSTLLVAFGIAGKLESEFFCRYFSLVVILTQEVSAGKQAYL
ncbi:MAG: hypothetical protein R3C12_01695 [Planctomycetaceae bacterium]